jgi:hypothetical protein
MSRPPGNLLIMLCLLPQQTVPMTCPFNIFHLVLLWCRMTAMMRFLFRPLCFLGFHFPSPLFALDLPHRLVDLAEALFGMVVIYLLLLPALLLFPSACPSDKRVWPMPSWVRFISLCYFFFFSRLMGGIAS